MSLYSIIDVETTGGDPKVDRITEIAIYLHDGEKVVDSFVSLINSEMPIPEFITALDPPQFDYGRHKARGCVITFDPMANAVNVRFIDPENGEDVYNESLTQD